MHGLSRRLCLVAAAAGLIAALGGADRALAQSTTAVTFSLDFRALGRHAAWYVALDKGYYKQAGLNVTIIPSQGTAQSIQNLESGVAQFSFSDVAGLVEARLLVGDGPPACKTPGIERQRRRHGVVVRDVVHGQPVRNTEALANPESLEHFRGLPQLR